MLYYVAVALITELTTVILQLSFNQKFQWVGNIFLTLELFFFASFFIRIYQPKQKRLVWAIVILIASIYIFVWLYTNPSAANPIAISVLCILYIITCIGSYWKILQQQQYQFIEHSSAFWITNGILVYASASSLIFFALAAMAEDRAFIIKIWSYIYIGVNILRYIFIAIGLRNYGKYGY